MGSGGIEPLDDRLDVYRHEFYRPARGTPPLCSTGGSRTHRFTGFEPARFAVCVPCRQRLVRESNPSHLLDRQAATQSHHEALKRRTTIARRVVYRTALASSFSSSSGTWNRTTVLLLQRQASLPAASLPEYQSRWRDLNPRSPGSEPGGHSRLAHTTRLTAIQVYRANVTRRESHPHINVKETEAHSGIVCTLESLGTAVNTTGRTRTDTSRGLSPPPLPLGHRGKHPRRLKS